MSRSYHATYRNVRLSKGRIVTSPVSGKHPYLQSQVTHCSGPTVYGDMVNFSGAALPFTPKWIAGLNADYRLPLTGGGKLFVGTSVKTQSTSVSVLGGENIGTAWQASCQWRHATQVTAPPCVP